MRCLWLLFNLNSYKPPPQVVVVDFYTKVKIKRGRKKSFLAPCCAGFLRMIFQAFLQLPLIFFRHHAIYSVTIPVEGCAVLLSKPPGNRCFYPEADS